MIYKAIKQFNKSLFDNGILNDEMKRDYYSNVMARLIDIHVLTAIKFSREQELSCENIYDAPSIQQEISQLDNEVVLYWSGETNKLTLYEALTRFHEGVVAKLKLTKLREFTKEKYFTKLRVELVHTVADMAKHFLLISDLTPNSANKEKKLAVIINELKSNASLLLGEDEE